MFQYAHVDGRTKRSETLLVHPGVSCVGPPACLPAATLRVSAARLLHATLIYGDAEVLPQLPTLVLALQTAVADEDAGRDGSMLLWGDPVHERGVVCALSLGLGHSIHCESMPGVTWLSTTKQLNGCQAILAGVALHAVGCAHVLGVNVPAGHWMPLAAEAVAAQQQSMAQRTAALVLLSALLYAAAKSGSAADLDCMQLAAATLGSSQLLAEAAAADGQPERQQLLAACCNLLLWAGPAAAAVAPQLLQMLLQLWALEAAGAELSRQGAAGSDPVAGSSWPSR